MSKKLLLDILESINTLVINNIRHKKYNFNFFQNFLLSPVNFRRINMQERRLSMKYVIIVVPLRKSKGVHQVVYPMDGNKDIEYEKPVRCPINGILAKTLKPGEQVKVIYIMAVGKTSNCRENKDLFIQELEEINADIGAKLEYDTIEFDFNATKQTYNKLLLDLADKIEHDSEIFADITYGHKTEVLSLLCAFSYVEEFHETVVERIYYGKMEFIDNRPVYPKIFDITSLYHLIKLIGSMGNSSEESARKTLNKFFAL